MNKTTSDIRSLRRLLDSASEFAMSYGDSVVAGDIEPAQRATGNRASFVELGEVRQRLQRDSAACRASVECSRGLCDRMERALRTDDRKALHRLAIPLMLRLATLGENVRGIAWSVEAASRAVTAADASRSVQIRKRAQNAAKAGDRFQAQLADVRDSLYFAACS